MKPLVHIIVGTSIVLLGLYPAFGNSLLDAKPDSDNRWTYIFLDRIIYDYALHRIQEKVYRHPGNRKLSDRWYYNYGRKQKPSNLQQYYQSYGYKPKDNIYSQPNYTPKNYQHRKPTQMRDHIPRNSFRYRSPFPRARIGH